MTPERAREPIPMLLFCPSCHARHIDRDLFATKSHHTHACQECGMVWRPAVEDTVGVQFLPGFKDWEGLDEDDLDLPGAGKREAIEAGYEKRTPPAPPKDQLFTYYQTVGGMGTNLPYHHYIIHGTDADGTKYFIELHPILAGESFRYSFSHQPEILFPALGRICSRHPAAAHEPVPVDLIEQLAAMTKDRDMWKANHDNQVEIKKAVLDRPDLADRARTILKLVEERDDLRLDLANKAAEVEVLKKEVEKQKAELTYHKGFSK